MLMVGMDVHDGGTLASGLKLGILSKGHGRGGTGRCHRVVRGKIRGNERTSVAFVMNEDAMDNNIKGSLQTVAGKEGKGATIRVLDDLLRAEILGAGMGSTNEITFIKDSSPKSRMIECADRKEALCILSRDMEVAIAMRDSIRAIGSRQEADGTGSSRSKGLIVMEHVKLVSTRGEGASVKLGTQGIRVIIHRRSIRFRCRIRFLREHIWRRGP